MIHGSAVAADPTRGHMTMATYRVILHVSSSELSTLLQTIDSTAGIRLVGVSDTADPMPLPPSPPPPPHVPAPEPKPTDVTPRRYVDGKRDKGIKGDELVLEVLRSGPASMGELKRAFVNRAFAAGSTGTYVSRLMKAKQIGRTSHGRYTLSASNGRAS
jgi:hypothetical protein